MATRPIKSWTNGLSDSVNVKLAVVENPIADEPWFTFDWLSW